MRHYWAIIITLESGMKKHIRFLIKNMRLVFQRVKKKKVRS